MSETLRLFRLVPHISALGPYSRLGIWTQGCLRGCPGCVSADAQPPGGGREVSFDRIEQMLLRFPEQEGLTVSGGEPFLQAEALARLIDRLRKRKEIGVILYTGYTLEELRGKQAPEGSGALLKRIDLLIDGPYIANLNDGGALRGSSNQRVIPLTERYRDRLWMYGAGRERQVELRYTEEGFGIVGVPPLRG